MKVVIINGGRGGITLIPALLKYPDIKLTSIVNAYDDGKSTGEIRDFFYMPGPSDIRKVQELMLDTQSESYNSLKELYDFRFNSEISYLEAKSIIQSFVDSDENNFLNIFFNDNSLLSSIKELLNSFLEAIEIYSKYHKRNFNFKDCAIMNCIYAGAYLICSRNFDDATMHFEKIFPLKGKVMPTSLEDKKLMALRENGDFLFNEAEIVELRSNVRIKNIFLLDNYLDIKRFNLLNNDEKLRFLELNHSYVESSPRSLEALNSADLIIYSSGTQHSSLYPTYITKGIASSIANNIDAKKVFITNIGADYETPSYKASDFFFGAYKYLNLYSSKKFNVSQLFTHIFINSSPDSTNPSHIEFDKENFNDCNIPIIAKNFEDPISQGKHNGDLLAKTIIDLI